MPAKLRLQAPGDKLHKLVNILISRNQEELYLGLVSHWSQPEELIKGAIAPVVSMADHSTWAAVADYALGMMYMDSITYLPDDILVKVDGASMDVSLEARVPMLDHQLVEFAWRLPMNMKIRQGQGKWILRQILYKHFPRELVDKPKMGFGVPPDSWLRGDFRDWAESLLNEDRIRREGYLNPKPIRGKWREHESSERNWQNHLWNILMFQTWLEAQS